MLIMAECYVRYAIIKQKEVVDIKICPKCHRPKINWTILMGDSRKLTELVQQKNLVGITSPPFLDQNQGTKPLSERNDGVALRLRKERPNTYDKTGAGSSSKEYSHNPSNIGNLKDKNLVGITSPPFENMMDKRDRNKESFIQDKDDDYKGIIKRSGGFGGYSSFPQNLGNQQGESYLQAMWQIYQQASQLMQIIVTVTKNPTRKGQLRRLDLDTCKLLMSCGYEIVDYHRSLLFEEKKQSTLSGKNIKQLKGRLSFFKRLSVQKGNKAASFEDIIIAVRR